MENNFSIINIEESGDQLQASKKIKVRGSDFSVLVSQRSKKQIVKDNFDRFNKDSFDLKSSENESLDEKVDGKEVFEKPNLEVVSPKKSNDEEYSFAYSGHKPEEDVTPEKIEAIKEEMNGKYREALKIESKETKETIEKMEDNKINDEIDRKTFDSELGKSSYSPAAKAYKANVSANLIDFEEKIKGKEAEIKIVTDKYSHESEIGDKLEETKNETQGVLNGINSWNMKFLEKRKDESTLNFIGAIESYFEENRKYLHKVIEEGKNCSERKEMLGKEEQKIREALAVLKKHLHDYLQTEYPKLVKVNKKDELLKETTEDMSELTGIDDKEYVNGIAVNREPAQSVASIENLREKRLASNAGSIPDVVGASNSFNNSSAYNRFETLREEENEGLGFRRAA